MAKCKACGADIEFIRLKSGKLHPCDEGYFRFREDHGTDRIVTLDGRIVAGTIVLHPTDKEMGTLQKGMSSHFATCPFADDFRRRSNG